MMRIHHFAAALAALSIAAAAATVVHAHEHRTVGDYTLVVGWANEPAFAGQPNGLDLRVEILADTAGDEHGDAATSTGTEVEGAAGDGADSGQAEAEPAEAAPVEGLEETLQAEVTFGDRTRLLELRTVWGQPGAYTSDLVPTAVGDYRFRIFGTIDGTEIDETFDSADGEFSGVESLDSLRFPEGGAGDASGVEAGAAAAGELANVRALADEANARVTAVESAVSTGRTMNLTGVSVGALALLLAAFALTRVGGR